MRTQVTLGQRAIRMALCATAAGMALASQTAHAVVITVDFSANALSSVPFNLDGFYLNVVTGATGTTGSATTGWDLNPYFSGTTAAPAVFRFFTPTGGAMVGTTGVASPLAAGTTIGAASTFVSGVLSAAQVPGTYTFGFRFLNEATTLTNYGYVTVQELVNPPTATGSVKVLGYAYENSGASITIPAVPEPSSVLMMFGGLLAVGAMAKRMSARRQDAA